MTVLDLMALLFYISIACLLFAALDAIWLATVGLRDRRRYRALLCDCGAWPFDEWGPVYADGRLHERFRCYPVEEAA